MTAIPGLMAAGGVLATAGLARRAMATSHRGRAARRLKGETQRPPSILPRLKAPRMVVTGLQAAGLDAPADSVWSLWLTAIVLVGAMAGFTAGPGPAVIVVLAGAVGPVLAVRSRRGEAARRFDAGVPVAMESIARSLRTGVSMHQAISEAARGTPGPLGVELRAVAQASAHGKPLVACLEQFAARHGMASVRLSVAALCLGIETGGSQARAIDGVATTLRERLAVTAELRALSSQARISALVIGVAPLGFALFAMLTDARTAEFLLHTGLGWAFVGAGLALDAVGWLWMRRLCGQGAAP